MDKSSLKYAKNGQFWRVFENLKETFLGEFQTLCGERKVGQEKNEFHAFHEFNKHKDDDEKTT